MDIEKLKELIEFMKEEDLLELEIEEEGKKIKLSRNPKQINVSPSILTPSTSQMPLETKPQEKKEEGLIEIKAPMVGTFYRAPAPDAQPYVEVGSQIDSGDVVCIIEAMKLMNEIKSEIKGEIVDILAENGEPVEYGQPLFLVKPLP